MTGYTYLATRFSSLKPACEAAPNPFHLLASLSRQQLVFFLVGFWAWSLDALDFHTASLTYAELSATFGKPAKDISVAVTLTLMSRPLGAAIFGIAADLFGRKWPFVLNMILLIIFELSAGFCQTYNQFLTVRALFGIAMGGVYGNAAATALEDCPEEARGLMSGIYQSGYSFGYLLATIFWGAFESSTNDAWRHLFWLAASLPLLLIVSRLLFGETTTFDLRVSLRNQNGSIGSLLVEFMIAMRTHWLLLIYLVLLMAGFSYMSHGSQDLYPLMLQDKYGYSPKGVTLVLVVANLGAITGGTVMGYFSQIFGRRFSIIVLCVIGAALLYPYTFISGPGIYAAVFFEQFCIQGAWGIIPIHLMELSPAPFRTFVVGTSYQLGNLISSASNSIETSIGEWYPLPPIVEGSASTPIYDYGPVMCIFVACTLFYVIVMAILGPEHRGRSMAPKIDDHETNRAAKYFLPTYGDQNEIRGGSLGMA